MVGFSKRLKPKVRYEVRGTPYDFILYIYQKRIKMSTSSDAACRVQAGSSTPGIVSESGLPMRMSAKSCIFLFASQSTILMRMHLQLQPVSSAEDQVFWHCAVWAV